MMSGKDSGLIAGVYDSNSDMITLGAPREEPTELFPGTLILQGQELPTSAELAQIASEFETRVATNTHLSSFAKQEIQGLFSSQLRVATDRQKIQDILVAAQTAITARETPDKVDAELQRFQEQIEVRLQKIKRNLEQTMGQFQVSVTDLQPDEGLFGENNRGYTWPRALLLDIKPISKISGSIHRILTDQTAAGVTVRSGIGNQVQEYVVLQRVSRYLHNLAQSQERGVHFAAKISADVDTFRIQVDGVRAELSQPNHRATIFDLEKQAADLGEGLVMNMNDLEEFFIELAGLA